MKRMTTLLMLGAVVAAVIEIWLFHGIFVTPFMVASSGNDPTGKAPFLGHVTYVLYDKNGNVKAYLQSDNVVTQKGKNCAVQLMFNNKTAVTGGVGGCSALTGGGSASTGFNWIGIGNGTTTVSDADTALNFGAITGEVQPRKQGSVTYTAASSGVGAKATIATTSNFAFTELTTGTTITQSGLFNQAGTIGAGGKVNAATTGDLFADQSITVAVSPSDTLSVSWAVTVG